ncbi:hypothetical protein K445DRAFT_304917 [Daldinia sp. EC12]|nr:hypothetical protein K445DRAFT_304917 [Daldinia sp. EC12]
MGPCIIPHLEFTKIGNVGQQINVELQGSTSDMNESHKFGPSQPCQDSVVVEAKKAKQFIRRDGNKRNKKHLETLFLDMLPVPELAISIYRFYTSPRLVKTVDKSVSSRRNKERIMALFTDGYVESLMPRCKEAIS